MRGGGLWVVVLRGVLFLGILGVGSAWWGFSSMGNSPAKPFGEEVSTLITQKAQEAEARAGTDGSCKTETGEGDPGIIFQPIASLTPGLTVLSLAATFAAGEYSLPESGSR
jgi:hypothetical protein